MAGRKRAAGIAAAVGIAAGGGAVAQAGATAAPAAQHGTPLGSRGGNGAAAGTRRSRWVDRLASRLGVSAAALKEALQDVRAATPRSDQRGELVRVLASGLGRSEAQVRAALIDGRARELGLDAATVRAAIDKVQDARRSNGRLPSVHGLGQALADELGVDVARLRDALRAVDGPKRARRGDARDIAAALTVDVADVRRILRDFRASEAARRQARQDAFATALAQELGMPVTQVTEALSAMPGRRGPHR
jgi:hypothetical protein